MITATRAAETVQDLADWSENCEQPTPFHLFLDLIGWSEEQLGETMCGNKLPQVGFLEAHKLAQALDAWSDRPREVEAAVNAITNDEEA